MRRLFVYSPIRPLKTGTANYIRLFLEQTNLDTSEVEVILVVDKSLYGSKQPEGVGYAVADWNEVIRTADDINLYFLANNEFHRYVHKAVHDHSKADGLAVAVVHEPSMWMNVQAMCVLREHGYSLKDLEYFAAYEFGEDASFIVGQSLRSQTDKNYQYTSLAATHIYENCDVIVFHSNFAMNKFILERSPTYTPQRKNMKYIVMGHPPDNGAVGLVNDGEPKPTFVAGAYGWVKRVKQVEAIITAYDEFYGSLDNADKQRVALHIVGEIDMEPGFDPVELAKKCSAHSTITFFGYVADDKLDKLMSQASLIFSLRFPSCGETSGPLYKARQLGAALVVSDYAAFAEMEAQYHIPVRKDLQHQGIRSALQAEFRRFKDGLPSKQAAVRAPQYDTVTEMLDKVISLKENSR